MRLADHKLLTLLLVMVVAAAISAALQMRPPRREIVEGTPVATAILNDPGTPAFGPRGADVTVVAFSDYDCAACKQGEAAFDKAIAADGHVRVMYKDWAALGDASRAGARVALAADRQGRYLPVHDALMRARVRPDADNVRAVATAAGADWPRLQADLARYGPAIDAILARHAFQAWSLGLQGPPGYLVGPYLVRGALSAAELRRLIVRARRRQASQCGRQAQPPCATGDTRRSI